MINFGIIGTSWITSSFILSAEATGRYKLRAVYSRKQAAAEEFAGKHKNNEKINIHTSVESLASESDIQVVYVASPNSLHYEQSKTILEAGKHVILEKPACSTSAELDSLFEISKKNNVFLIEAYRHVNEPNFKILKSSLSKLGQIFGASINFCQYSSRYDAVVKGETPNVFSLEFSGGALADLGVYPVAAAIDLFGPPKSATYSPVKIQTGADGGGMILMQYENFPVSINTSKMYWSKAPSEVYGAKGSLVVPTITDIESVKFCDRVKKEEVEMAGEKAGKDDPMLNLMDEAKLFADWIEKGDKDAMARWEQFSKDVQKTTENLRHQNGLKFKVEQ